MSENVQPYDFSGNDLFPTAETTLLLYPTKCHYPNLELIPIIELLTCNTKVRKLEKLNECRMIISKWEFVTIKYSEYLI